MSCPLIGCLSTLQMFKRNYGVFAGFPCCGETLLYLHIAGKSYNCHGVFKQSVNITGFIHIVIKLNSKHTSLLNSGLECVIWEKRSSIATPFIICWVSGGGMCTLKMFCLLNPQMNACEPNPKTTSSDFNRWKFLTKIFCFHAISKDICLLF